MANALDAVLAFKANEQAQQKAQADSILQAAEIFQRARQNAQANQLAQLQLAQQGKYQDATIANQNADNARQQEQLNLQKPLWQSQIDENTSQAESRKANLELLNRITGGGGNSIGSNAKISIGPGGLSVQLLSPDEIATNQLQLEKLQYDRDARTPEGKQKEIQEEVNKQKALAEAKGIPTAEAGRAALAKESLENIDDIINILYPDGTPKSFNREIATRSNLPGISLPFVGRVTPQVSPDNPLSKGDDEKARKAQDVFRKMGASISGRQLIQTGVAARPEETAKLVSQFAPGLFTNPDAGLKGLKELKAFYKDYLDKITPGGNKDKSNNSINPGESITINGKVIKRID